MAGFEAELKAELRALRSEVKQLGSTHDAVQRGVKRDQDEMVRGNERVRNSMRGPIRAEEEFADSVEKAKRRLRDKQRRVEANERAMKDLGQTSRQTNQFMGMSADSLVDLAAGAANFNILSNTIAQSWQRVQQAVQQSSSTLQQSQDSVARLLSLGSSPAERRALRAEADRVSTQTGMSESDAADLVFNLRSNDMGDFVDQFAAFGLTGNDAGAMAASVANVRSAARLGNRDVPRILNTLMAGSDRSPVGPDQFAMMVARVMPAARAIGASLDETVAFMSQTRGADPAEMATAVRNIATAAATRGERGGFQGILQRFGDLDEAAAFAELGSESALGLDLIRGAASTATPLTAALPDLQRGALDAKVRGVLQDPNRMAVVVAQIAEQAARVEQQELGRMQLQQDAQQNLAIAQQFRAGVNPALATGIGGSVRMLTNELATAIGDPTSARSEQVRQGFIQSMMADLGVGLDGGNADRLLGTLELFGANVQELTDEIRGLRDERAIGGGE